MLLKTKCDHLHHVCADGLAPWWWKWSRRGFSLFTAYQILSYDFYFQGALTTAWRRVTIQHLRRKKHGVIFCSDHIVWPRDLICAWPHSYRCCLSIRPHAAVDVFLSCFPCYSYLPDKLFWDTLLHLKMMTTYHFLGHGFDHILDHSHIRSTRRQECTRVWKSRFCVAERARKSKNG